MGGTQPSGQNPTQAGKAPIDLRPSQALLNGIVGTPGTGNVPIPTRPDPLLTGFLPQTTAPESIKLQPEKGGGFKYIGPNIIAHIKPDGQVAFEDRSPVQFNKGTSGFSFDLTDIAQRARKQDPYLPEKTKFIAATEALRNKLRDEALREQTQQAQQSLAAQLQSIWQSGQAIEAKRKALFEVWMEIGDEPGPSKAAILRKQWLSFVRSTLPEKSPDAYTQEEIRHCDERRQREELRIPFRPYKPASKTAVGDEPSATVSTPPVEKAPSVAE